MSTNNTADSLWDDDDDDNLNPDGTPKGDNPEPPIPPAPNGNDNPEPPAPPAGITNADLHNDDDDDDDANKGGDPKIEAPGIEQYLAQYGIIGGIITFEGEDGEAPVQKHYNDLTPDEQFNVLSSLAEKGSPDVNAKFGLDENEIGLLNYVRGYAKQNAGAGVNEAIEALAQQRVAQLLALQNSSATDFTTMDDDAIATRWLKASNPDATEEELVAELEHLRGSRFFASQVKSWREGFIAEQQLEASNAEAAYNSEIEATREEDRRLIATTAAQMDTVAGFAFDNTAKNEILGKILEVNEHGDSQFMEEVFGDPNRLIKAAWLYYNIESYLDEMNKNHKRDLANEFQRGKHFALNGFPAEPVSGLAPNDNNKNNPDRTERRPQGVTAADLWADED